MNRLISARRGFTVMEVLAALAILAMAGMALALVCAHLLELQAAVSRQDPRRVDQYLIHQRLGEEPDRTKVEAGESMKLPDGGLANWRGEIEPTGVADLFKVTLHIEFNAHGGGVAETRQEILHLLRPTWSTADMREALRNQTRARLAKGHQP